MKFTVLIGALTIISSEGLTDFSKLGEDIGKKTGFDLSKFGSDGLKVDFSELFGEKVESGNKNKSVGEKECQTATAPGIQPGLETAEFRLNGDLDLEYIDSVLQNGADFDSDSLAVTTTFDSSDPTGQYVVKSARYGGSGCPPQDTSSTADGFTGINTYGFVLPQPLSLTCPTDPTARASLPIGVTSECFVRWEIEADFGACDGSSGSVTLPTAVGGNGYSAAPSGLSFGVDVQMIYSRNIQTALLKDGELAFQMGRTRSRSTRSGFGEGFGDGPTYFAPVTLDAAGGCADGKVNFTVYTAWQFGFQATKRCTAGATVSTDIVDLSDFDSLEFQITFGNNS